MSHLSTALNLHIHQPSFSLVTSQHLQVSSFCVYKLKILFQSTCLSLSSFERERYQTLIHDAARSTKYNVQVKKGINLNLTKTKVTGLNFKDSNCVLI